VKLSFLLPIDKPRCLGLRPDFGKLKKIAL
jgi:hypothetical protein